ncbi:STAS domain-containing protein [Thiomicrorhabdus sp.]|uniref:STAS domain-containing protein n=1 Tax=Thiomicrorhabdus sp. TaxID=2039724 RepID=UPI0029C7BABD|nr:STAS domain-containing protein [Thiomicrorhabdus sp.]
MANPIVLNDSLTIHNIQAQFDELKQQFAEADSNLLLDASAVENIDTSGFQMLLALKRHAGNSGKQVKWQGVGENFLQLSEKLNLQKPLNLSV